MQAGVIEGKNLKTFLLCIILCEIREEEKWSRLVIDEHLRHSISTGHEIHPINHSDQ
jgi:hypothetical protein